MHIQFKSTFHKFEFQQTSPDLKMDSTSTCDPHTLQLQNENENENEIENENENENENEVSYSRRKKK